jgi:hypothetical protein
MGTSGGSAGGGLPAGGSVGQIILNSGAGAGVWAGPPLEDAASQLVNATSAGDAGGRADHFPGTSLNPKWTLGGAALTSSTVKNSVYVPVAGGGFSTILQTYTPSGLATIAARMRRGPVTSSQMWLMMADSAFAVGPFAGNCVLARLADNTGANGPTKIDLATVDAGVFTSRGNIVTTLLGDEWWYINLNRTGTTWKADFSLDGAAFQEPTTFVKTMTVAFMGIVVTSTGAGFSAVDSLDVLV